MPERDPTCIGRVRHVIGAAVTVALDADLAGIAPIYRGKLQPTLAVRPGVKVMARSSVTSIRKTSADFSSTISIVRAFFAERGVFSNLFLAERSSNSIRALKSLVSSEDSACGTVLCGKLAFVTNITPEAPLGAR